ncbi:MAG: DUF935 family protein [Verrucomicrobiota bacterium]
MSERGGFERVCTRFWESRAAGKAGQIIAPKATQWVHPVCYAWDMNGRLGLRLELRNPNPENRSSLSPGVFTSTTMQPRPSQVGAFPPDKFLIGICKAKSGTALGGARLRALAWWWCAANFSADWLLNLAQIFGLPFRWANYDPNAPQATIDSICAMLEGMGSNAWAAFPAGTTLELKEAGKTGSASPSGDMLDRADKNCDLIVLGQTLTSDVGNSGSRALGDVHATVKHEIVEAVCGYVAGVLNTQLVPSILRLNYGDEAELPQYESDKEEEKTVEYKQEVLKLLAQNAALTPALANLIDVKQLVRDAGLTLNEGVEMPVIEQPILQKNEPAEKLEKENTGNLNRETRETRETRENQQGPKGQQGQGETVKARTGKSQISDFKSQSGGFGVDSGRLVKPVMGALAKDMEPVRARLAKVLALPEDQQAKALAELEAALPELLDTVNANTETVDAMQQALNAAWVQGIEEAQLLQKNEPAEKLRQKGLAARNAGNAGEEEPLMAGEFDEELQPRDERGQFTYKGAIGNTGDWSKLGLPHSVKIKADPASPEMDPNEARQKLTSGFKIKDYAGRELLFTKKVIEHWEHEGYSKAEQDRRLRRINDAIATGENPREQWDKGWQRNYLRVSADGNNKRRYHVGFVTDQTGDVISFYHTERATQSNKLREGTLTHGRDW